MAHLGTWPKVLPLSTLLSHLGAPPSPHGPGRHLSPGWACSLSPGLLCKDLAEIRRGCRLEMGSLGGSPALQLASFAAVGLALPLSSSWKQGEDSPPPRPPELWG